MVGEATTAERLAASARYGAACFCGDADQAVEPDGDGTDAKRPARA